MDINKKIITSKRHGIRRNIIRLYEFRRLILIFAKRDIKVQYAQTFLGLLSSVLQPLTALVVFTLFFDKLLDITHRFGINMPYPLFAFTGMIPWYFFTMLIGNAGTSLSQSEHLIKKIFFPKLVLPLSKVLVGLVEFCVSSVFLVILMLIYQYKPPLSIIYLPVFIFLNILTGLSIGIWLSALTIRYRDFHHFIPYLISFGIWLTPVFYPGSLIPADKLFYIHLNPMAGVIAGFRWCILGDAFPDLGYLKGFIPVIILFISGLMYFRKVENKVVDFV
jgi:lipopolysaccharide transport system permease protein